MSYAYILYALYYIYTIYILYLYCTVSMKSLITFSGDLHFLHHYDSNFSHLLAFKNLVIEYLNSKR